jgi:hypothetical protein
MSPEVNTACVGAVAQLLCLQLTERRRIRQVKATHPTLEQQDSSEVHAEHWKIFM